MRKNVKAILEHLESLGYVAYIVGGYVRDYLLGKESTDYDICTNAPMKEIRKFYPGKVHLNSSMHLKMNEVNITITTFRKEYRYVGHHPKIIYINALEEDLQRRDFTINTICMDKNGVVIDKLDGITDLKQKIIRVVGNPEEKLNEDPLRILRAIRFATVLDFELEENVQLAIKKYGYLLEKLSTYRIKEELDKILVSSHCEKGLGLLKEFDLITYLGISFTNVRKTTDLCGMWAQIAVFRDYPFTKSEKKNIVMLQEILKEKGIHNETLYKYGLYLSLVAAELLGIKQELVMDMYQQLPLYVRDDLALSFIEIQEILQERASFVRKTEEVLIKEVLNGHLENKKEVLKTYILENKGRLKIDE